MCASLLFFLGLYIVWKKNTEPYYRFISASSWWSGEWSECSRSCNGGLRTREVLCKRRISVVEEKVLDDSACTAPCPSFTEPCSNHSCPPEWLALDWSEVDAFAVVRMSCIDFCNRFVTHCWFLTFDLYVMSLEQYDSLFPSWTKTQQHVAEEGNTNSILNTQQQTHNTHHKWDLTLVFCGCWVSIHTVFCLFSFVLV